MRRDRGGRCGQKHKCAAIGNRTVKPVRWLFHYCRATFKDLLNLRVQLLKGEVLVFKPFLDNPLKGKWQSQIPPARRAASRGAALPKPIPTAALRP